MFLLITAYAVNGSECPPNTVEIVFTKSGILCATTSYIPELQHFAVNPKDVPQLIGNNPPVEHHVTVPIVPEPVVNPYDLFRQMPHLVAGTSTGINSGPQLSSSIMPIYSEPPPVRPPTADYMTSAAVAPIISAVPIVYDHINYIGSNNMNDRRPDLIDDKRLHYQRMLWEKLRRDSWAKHLLKKYQQQKQDNSQQLNNMYDMTAHNNHNNMSPYDPNLEIQHSAYIDLQKVDPKMQSHSQLPVPTNDDSSSSPSQTINEGIVYETSADDNSGNDADTGSQQTTDIDDKQTDQSSTVITNGDNSINSNQQQLKEYLNYLKNNNKRHTSDNTHRHHDLVKTSSQVPDIIRGVMPSAPIINQNRYVPSDEPIITENSYVSYNWEQLNNNDNRYQNKKLINNPMSDSNSLRVVKSDMTFGQRLTPNGQIVKQYVYNKEKPQMMAYNDNEKVSDNSVDQQNDKHNDHTYNKNTDEEVVLVTADPQQMQMIEKLEAEQQLNPHHNYNQQFDNNDNKPKLLHKFESISTNVDSNQKSNNHLPVQTNALHSYTGAIHKVRNDFRLDGNRIEYNGWQPLRRARDQLISDKNEEHRESNNDEMASASSSITNTWISKKSHNFPNFIPIVGKPENHWLSDNKSRF
ncbi:GATA zinc finger domain-containing protein 14-like [Oppia nitens]|uniref:GATA zinc finger domain-containing protein 14-like n=1 Tax=Oppia nitens TaxID=1686743 RepID=UPI0023DA6800|nr:GATA zinc finger domain-containing protein 14-like [Oppia nitens]